MHTEHNEQWGAYINAGYNRTGSMPEKCRAWVKPMDKDAWEKRGVVIWSQEAQRVEVLSANHALALLNHLRTTDTWKVDGIPITQQYTRFTISEQPRKRRSCKKGDEQVEPADQNSASKPETVIEERFRLAPDASAEFLELLQSNEATLQRMAEEDEKHGAEVMRKVYSMLFRYTREKEGNEIDFSARPFAWVQDEKTLTWMCDRPPNRGSVLLISDNFFWQGCIEQPDRFKHLGPPLVNLDQALAWVEQELASIEQAVDKPADDEQDEWQKVPLPELIAQKRTELAAYWIEPAKMEPERITYRVIIVLEYEPYDFKTMEISFGKQLRCEKKFASPARLAQELQLDPIQVEIKQRYNGLYSIASHVSYYREDVAAAQAQQLWDKSSVVKQYVAGKVVWAQYGYEEVETGYGVMIGGGRSPWSGPSQAGEPAGTSGKSRFTSNACLRTGCRGLSGLFGLAAKVHKRRGTSRNIARSASRFSSRAARRTDRK